MGASRWWLMQRIPGSSQMSLLSACFSAGAARGCEWTLTLSKNEPPMCRCSLEPCWSQLSFGLWLTFGLCCCTIQHYTDTLHMSLLGYTCIHVASSDSTPLYSHNAPRSVLQNRNLHFLLLAKTLMSGQDIFDLPFSSSSVTHPS